MKFVVITLLCFHLCNTQKEDYNDKSKYNSHVGVQVEERYNVSVRKSTTPFVATTTVPPHPTTKLLEAITTTTTLKVPTTTITTTTTTTEQPPTTRMSPTRNHRVPETLKPSHPTSPLPVPAPTPPQKAFNYNYLYLLLLVVPVIFVVALIGLYYRFRKRKGTTQVKVRESRGKRHDATVSWVFREPEGADDDDEELQKLNYIP